jgi:hypothetical protein
MSSPSMSLGTIIDQCQNRKWEEMHMCFPFKEMAPKLLMVACRQTHEANSKYKLDDYDKYLMKTVGAGFASMVSLVHLADFTGAHQLSVKHLKDDAVAITISEYVKKHASVLGWMLKDSSVPDFAKEATLESFPFLKDVVLTPENEIEGPKPDCVIQ